MRYELFQNLVSAEKLIKFLFVDFTPVERMIHNDSATVLMSVNQDSVDRSK